jgi:hypothetical protein
MTGRDRINEDGKIVGTCYVDITSIKTQVVSISKEKEGAMSRKEREDRDVDLVYRDNIR